jgi:L-2,4-diaminobutyrate decarboxylase
MKHIPFHPSEPFVDHSKSTYPEMAPNTSSDLLTYAEMLSSVQKELHSLVNQNPSILSYQQCGIDDPLVSNMTYDEMAGIEAKVAPGSAPRPLKDVISDAKYIYSSRARLNHPRFFSFVPAAPLPVSWLGDMVNEAFNTFSASWLLGPGVSTVEISLCAWLAAKIGFPPTAGGTFVSGGSMANLTAMVMARDQKLGQDITLRARGVVYLSDQAHFCVPKCLHILGFLPEQVRVLPSDSAYRIDVDELEQAIQWDIKDGRVPFLVVVTCGTTNSGSIDPMCAVADIAQAHNLWMHVDGAYGASVALCHPRRHLVEGLNRADSVAWDAHKWLFQTYGCGMVFARERVHLPASFATTAEYMRDLVDDDKTPNLWNYSTELTRPARHMRLWFTLQALGLDTISRMISHGFELAELVENELRLKPDWEIIFPANLAIVNFRYHPMGRPEQDLDQLNEAISTRLLAENVAAITTTRLKTIVCLRICALNPTTTDKDIREVIDALDEAAQHISK